MPRIVCLGWGSLIWEPGVLGAHGVRAGRVEDGGSWHGDGPLLPLELARDSMLDGDPDRRLVSWVITPATPPSPTLWASLEIDAIEPAVQALARREGIDASLIGRWPSDDADEVVAEWARAHHHDAVVWTALPPQWLGVSRVPSSREVIAFLADLVRRDRAAHAETYVRRTPRQTQSPYRREIELRLGWSPSA